MQLICPPKTPSIGQLVFLRRTQVLGSCFTFQVSKVGQLICLPKTSGVGQLIHFPNSTANQFWELFCLPKTSIVGQLIYVPRTQVLGS